MINLLLSVVLSCLSCTKAKTGDPEPPTPEPEIKKLLNGSFADKFLRLFPGESYSGPQTVLWSDTCWKRDRLHKQIVLWAKKDISGITYQVTDLVDGGNKIPASNIRLRFEKYVKGDQNALDCAKQVTRNTLMVPDALSEDKISIVSPSDPVKIWVTADIPSGIAAGTYIGSVKVISVDTTLVFGIKFLVTGKDLPAVADWRFHLDLWQFPYQLTTLVNGQGVNHIEPFSSEYFSMMEPFYKLLADGGQKAITAYIKDGSFLEGQTMIRWMKNADETWSYDYTNFDKYVDTLMSWGITKQISCFSVAGWNSNIIWYHDAASGTTMKLDAPIGSAAFNTAWQHFLTKFKTHLDTKGWFDRTVLCMDESPDEIMQAVITTIKNNDPNWKIGLAGSHASDQSEKQLYDYSTIFGTSRINKPSVNTISTFYTSCTQTVPNNYITRENSPAEMPWMSWYALSMGLNGYLRWAFDYWTLTESLNIQDGANTAGDFSFIYRSGNSSSSKPLSSVRFELLREGIQDYEKIRILTNGNPAPFQTLLDQFKTSVGTDAVQLVGQGESAIKIMSVTD